MSTHKMLQTEGDPLAAIQKLLHDIWATARLDGMLVPRRPPGSCGVQMVLAQERGHFGAVDPFAPVMAEKAAVQVIDLARNHPLGSWAAVLRPCEVRVVYQLAHQHSVKLDHVLIIGVDCLATFPEEDYRWRAEKWHSTDRLTDEALKFARLGGINAYRYRPACQMCPSPVPEAVDLSIGVLGLAPRKFLLVTARNEAIAHRIHLDQIANGEATPTLADEHEKMRVKLMERHAHARERAFHALAPELPKTINDVIQHLRNCAPCRSCIETCPLCSALFYGDIAMATMADVNRWLASCAQCGMCEEACPRHLPLTAIFGRINEELVATV